MTDTRTVTIVDPTAKDVAERFARAPRLASLEGRTRWIDASDPGTRVPIVASPDDFILVVAGGDGRHSAWMPAWSACRGATEPVEE